jgi:hypothetical protein
MTSGLLIALTLGQLSASRRVRSLIHHESSGEWVMRQEGCSEARGSLVQAGYRSAWLLVLVIQAEDTRWHRIVVWHDQVTSLEFSYLHQQLAFAAVIGNRRTASAWLADLVSHTSISPKSLSGRIGRRAGSHWQRALRWHRRVR